MNIFVLDKNPHTAAQMTLNKHTIKMPTESMQMICTNLSLLGYNDKLPMKSVMKNHPCTIWARLSQENFMWLWNHCKGLCQEYTKRYYGRIHKVEEYWDTLSNNGITTFIGNVQFPLQGLTPFALAMPDECKVESSAVESYRKYYIMEKSHIAEWKEPSKAPSWWPQH
tara:strand:- start:202 stop:705 length:504 start_codon:yes stop_codon:yes gene_type:complete